MTSVPRGIPKQTNGRTMSIQTGTPVIARSPKDSPPTMKKKLCRLVNGVVGTKVSTTFSDLDAFVKVKERMRQCENSPHPPNGGNSILKKLPSKGSPLSSQTGSPAEARRVQFRQHVTVFLMSDDGDVFCSECRKLNSDTENHRPIPRSMKSQLICQSQDNNYSLSPPPYGSCNGIHGENCSLKATDESVESSQVAFQFVEDVGRGTILKFVVPLGHDYKPDDIVVKANVSGSRVRLVANKPVAYPDGSMRMEQLSKRFMLPTEVDPYLVTARLDIKGQLTVEAPVLSTTRKEGLRKSHNTTLRDISNKSS